MKRLFAEMPLSRELRGMSGAQGLAAMGAITTRAQRGRGGHRAQESHSQLGMEKPELTGARPVPEQDRLASFSSAASLLPELPVGNPGESRCKEPGGVHTESTCWVQSRAGRGRRDQQNH